MCVHSEKAMQVTSIFSLQFNLGFRIPDTLYWGKVPIFLHLVLVVNSISSFWLDLCCLQAYIYQLTFHNLKYKGRIWSIIINQSAENIVKPWGVLLVSLLVKWLPPGSDCVILVLSMDVINCRRNSSNLNLARASLMALVCTMQNIQEDSCL